MDEIFTKEGTLRAQPPKEFICKACGKRQNKRQTTKIKLPGVTFQFCDCGGGLMHNPAYSLWYEERAKLVSGQ